jgi:hypothetical protein
MYSTAFSFCSCDIALFAQETYTSHKCGAKVETRQSQRNRKKAADNRDEENRHMSTEGEQKDEDGSGELVLKEKSSQSGGLVCDVCGEVYKTIHILKAHMQLHGKREIDVGRLGSRLRGYHPVAPRRLGYRPFVHHL